MRLVRSVVLVLFAGGAFLQPGHSQDLGDRVVHSRDTGSSSVNSQDTGSLSVQAIFISDIHFNPLYDTALVEELRQHASVDWDGLFRKSAVMGYGPYGKDCNYPLLQSLLEGLAHECSHPRYIFISGDVLAHDLGKKCPPGWSNMDKEDFIRKTMEFAAASIHDKFPDAIILPCIGNNDNYGGDYTVAPAFLKMFAETWLPYMHFDRNTDSVRCRESLLAGGFYNYPLSIHPAVNMLALNSTSFSPQYTADKPLPAQLRWLNDQLEADTAATCWMLFHIPPGVDAFKTDHGKDKWTTQQVYEDTAPPVLLWQADTTRCFLDIVGKYGSRIAGMLAGHSHKDEFRLLKTGTDGGVMAYIQILPSVCMSNFNNPAFRIATLDGKSLRLWGYRTWWLDPAVPGGAWQYEYEVKDAVPEEPVTVHTIEKMVEKLHGDAAFRARFFDRFNTQDRKGQAVNIANQQVYMAALEYPDREEYKQQLKK